MLDGVSLDQLRIFIAAVDEGSFSAAGRRLRRAQSVVSEAIAALEQQVGVQLFDRARRTPALTQAGIVLLADARGVVAGVDAMKARARGIAGGLEPELSAVVDVLYPIDAITCAAKTFQQRFPATSLRLYVEAIGGAYVPVLDGRCSIGVVGPLSSEQPSLTSERLAPVDMVMVATPGHPLAACNGPIPRAELARHLQLVLTDRSSLSAGQEFGVLSPRTWRLVDLFTKREFLLAGLGWGGMPAHSIRQDVADGRLVVLAVEDAERALRLPMSAIYRTAAPPGPAGRWFIEHLRAAEASHLPQEGAG